MTHCAKSKELLRWEPS